jgi:hypothetical protein
MRRPPPDGGSLRCRDCVRADTVGVIARFLGHTSEYPVNGAFTRVSRITPGRCRTRTGSARHGHLRIRRVRAPVSRVITAATQKDRIDADIQLAGLKPMACPMDVHAEAHQDTYPGLMSW